METVELRALLHVHTTASDGTASISDVITLATDAGIDILGINDHNTLTARELGRGGWNGNLLVLAGAELEDPEENNHLLVYGVDSLPMSGDPHEQIDAVNSQGGLAIIAHPCESAGKLRGTRSYPWTAGSATGAAGVEIWNYMSAWKGGLGAANLIPRLILPDRWVMHPDPDAIELWMSTGGCAVACPDAHAFRFGPGRLSVEVFPYRMLFRRLVTHVLLEGELPDDGVEAERKVLQALRRGRCFTSNMLHGDATGFRAAIDSGLLLLQLPSAGIVSVSGEGSTLLTSSLRAGTHSIPVQGLSRAVVRVIRNGRTWICACIS